MKKFLQITFVAVTLLPVVTLATQTNADSLMKAAQVALAGGDYEKAFASYQTAVQQHNNPLAQFTIGLFYQNGWGRAADPVIACRWFEQAAQGGIPTAQYMTGICLEQGSHRPVDFAAAAHWYQKAAQAGQLHANCRLGNLLMTGRGITKDPHKALALCRPAALQGSLSAQLWLGKFYLHGDSTIQNLQEAYHWFATAAQNHAPEAFYYLGMIMQQGMLNEQKPEIIRQMFEQAAALKFVPAYFQAGKQFYSAEPDSHTHQLTAEHLAKAYLWLSAATQRSEDQKEVAAAKEILQQILTVMPQTWRANLDMKIAQHLQEN